MKIRELQKVKQDIINERNQQAKEIQDIINALLNTFETKIQSIFKNISVDITQTHTYLEIYIGEQTILYIKDGEIEENNGVPMATVDKIMKLHKELY